MTKRRTPSQEVHERRVAQAMREAFAAGPVRTVGDMRVAVMRKLGRSSGTDVLYRLSIPMDFTHKPDWDRANAHRMSGSYRSMQRRRRADRRRQRQEEQAGDRAVVSNHDTPLLTPTPPAVVPSAQPSSNGSVESRSVSAEFVPCMERAWRAGADECIVNRATRKVIATWSVP